MLSLQLCREIFVLFVLFVCFLQRNFEYFSLERKERKEKILLCLQVGSLLLPPREVEEVGRNWKGQGVWAEVRFSLRTSSLYPVAWTGVEVGTRWSQDLCLVAS